MTYAARTALAVAVAVALAPLTAEAKSAKAKPKSETAEIDAFFKDIDTSISKTMKQIDKDLASLSKPPK
jgi:hypothetical protein